MNLLKLDNLQLAYGEQIIFNDVNLVVNAQDRLCLVGRNGVGKSTLLKVIEGVAEIDGGARWVNEGSVVTGLMQDLPEQCSMTVRDFVAAGLPALQADLERYAALSVSTDMDDLNEMARIQARIEAVDGWNIENRIDQVLTQLELNGALLLSDMSGGWRRRAALAQALVARPAVLLLDEPTNHLDIKAIEWLESELKEFPGAVIFVTHDRQFLRNVANRIGELDRGSLSVWDANYDDFLRFRQQQLDEEEKHNAAFDKKLAKEEVWIRQGIKARRTRNEGRVRALKKMREERAQRRASQKTASIHLEQDTRSGKLVAELKDVSFSWDPAQPIIQNFSTRITRGDKIGLIGPNGVGKSTFLKIVLGELAPTEGEVKLGSNLTVAYFDQLRDQLDLEKSAMENIAGGREYIDINGKPKHAISYLNDFLFTGERARTPIKTLSGGERNRILLAKLFSKPSNLLILDEPTNDLDAETLDLLEELLINFEGTLMLVSHDRAFLDNVVTSTIGFEGQGHLQEYIGGYADWQRQGGVWAGQQTPASKPINDEKNRSGEIVSEAIAVTDAAPAASKGKEKQPEKKIKLSYKLQRELDSLPAEIEQREARVEELQAMVSAADFYQKGPEYVAEQLKILADENEALEQCYSRWEELELLKEG